MNRRELLAATAAIAGSTALPAAAMAEARSRPRPGQTGWPSEADWSALNQTTGGRLVAGGRPALDTPEAKKLLSNPFYIGDQSGLTESSGWLDAWRSAPSAYVVKAESASDIAAAVRFAGAHNLRLVVKGRGHSYLGGSTAPDSLLVWTRAMDGVTVHDGFTPGGSKAAPVPAVSVGAGCMWLHAYQAVTTGAGRYVQGGGCTTVGVAGLIQGGGFGSYSKAYGLAAASLLEAEIVTADGQIHVVNHVREPDLFWALKGGGGGTFGIITRLTLATHPLPETFGAVQLKIKAHSNEAYRRLLARFVEVYATNLFNPHWGETVHIRPDNRFDVTMVCQGLTQAQAVAAWKPLIDFANANSADYEGQNGFFAIAFPARRFWDADFLRRNAPGATTPDGRPGATATDFSWSGDGDQIGLFWHAYTSAWLPADLLKPRNQSRLVDACFNASRQWGVGLHFNKGLAGASAATLEAARDTAMNPDVVNAFALAIIATGDGSLYTDGQPDLATARANAGRVHAATAALRVAAPNTGAYVNECDYFEPNWQKAFWGPNYTRLARVKRRYDPKGLFTVHHGVGSEAWSTDGFTRST